MHCGGGIAPKQVPTRHAIIKSSAHHMLVVMQTRKACCTPPLHRKHACCVLLQALPRCAILCHVMLCCLLLCYVVFALQVGMYATSRIIAAVARAHMLPPFLARVHKKLGTPYISTILSGVTAAVMALFTGGLQGLLRVCDVDACVYLHAVVTAVWLLTSESKTSNVCIRACMKQS